MTTIVRADYSTDSTRASGPPAGSNMLQPARSPLFLDGLVEFNRRKWGVEPCRVRFGEVDGAPAVEALYYLNRAGRIWKPPTTSTYLPVAFLPTATQSRARLDRQWLAVATLLAEDMRERGLANVIPLPPEVGDARPWQWAGFRVEVRYTFYTDLPYDDSLLDPSVRRQIAKCERSGFRWERARDLRDVYTCLAESETRQGFSYRLDLDDLELAQDLLGPDALRAYVCFAPDGEPASARVTLHQPGARALEWVNGNRAAYLNSGSAQFLLRHVLDDLAAAGATGFDFIGATLPTVAASKATWGASLAPFYAVDGGRLRALARFAREYARFRGWRS